MQGQVVDPIFKGHNPTVKQVAWTDELSTEVVDQQNTTIGFYLERRLIEFIDIVKYKVKTFKR